MQSTTLTSGDWRERFTYTKMVPFDLGQAVFQVVRFKPGDSISYHYHRWTLEVYMVTDGTGTLFIDGEDHAMRPGSMFLIEPLDAHAIVAGKNGIDIAIFKPCEYPDDIFWGRSGEAA